MAKKAAKKTSGDKPEMRAFLACDAVSQDSVSGGKSSLHGIFDIILVEKVPSAFRPFFLYLRLAPGKGTNILSFHGTGVDGADLIATDALEVKLNPKGHTDIVCRIGSLPLTGVGTVTFVVKVNGKAFGWPCNLGVQKRTTQK